MNLLKSIIKNILTLLVLAGLVWLGYKSFAGGEKKRDEAAAVEKVAVPVAMVSAEKRDFEDHVLVQGNVRAKNFAMVGPVIGGTIEAIHVSEGDSVVAGETKLFEVDSVTLTKALEVRRQDLAVAMNARLQKEASLEQVQADFHKAEVDLRRYELLYEDNVVSIDVLEQQQSRHKQLKAAIRLSESVVQLGVEQEKQAAIAVEIAEKNLRDAVTVAPISGLVTAKLAEVGEMGSAGTPVLRIEDPSELEVTAFLPAQYYDRVREGETTARISVYGIDAGTLPVTYKSPAINPKLRSFEVRLALPAPPAGVATGAIGELALVLERRSGVAVPSAAVVTRDMKKLVFTVENDTARSLEVKTGLENGGWIEIMSGVAEATPVVTMGQTLIEDGGPVKPQSGVK